MIHVNKLVLGEQTFTWADASGDVYHFAVDRLNSFLDGTDFLQTRVALESVYRIVMNWIAIDPEHVKKLPEDSWKYPITLLQWHDGSHVIVDGGHRVCKMKSQGFDIVYAWVVPVRLWERFLITGIPGSHDYWHEQNQDPTRREPKKRETIYGTTVS